ncbi:glycerophosphodiester phosphodiesterase [Paenibacillus sp. Soil522]|uniref:glycerophosphodiester phosphodiesterase n=1 Tax=Paenibacillus sp. Soil522 TaxID=1736388 RepID=UPI000701E46A|nr:glycerophosphodiester phosphodiesterase [Paenibacillus sp. Soil522]KRE47013.1 glycerophosphodiester phosphodiesterase [Paenibacillus sp. Soil522]
MIQLFERSIRDFRDTYKKHLLFEYLFLLLTSSVIMPIISFIFNRIIRVVGSGSVLNGEVYQVGLSYTGAAGLIAIGLVAVLALFIEFGVVITIAQQHYFGKEVLISDAVLTTLRQTPKLFGFGIIQLLFFLLFFVPFIDSPLSSSLFALFNVPIFFNSRILNSSFMMLALYGILFLAGVYIILRWIFVLHFIMIEGKTIRRAIRSSLVLTKGKRLVIFIHLFILNAVVFTLGFVVISSVAYLPSWLDINVLKAMTDHYSLTLSTVLTYMFTLLLVPVNIIFLTRLFYHFSLRQGVMPRDQLRVYESRFAGSIEKRLLAFIKGRTRKRMLYVTILVSYLALALFVSYAANDNLVYVKWSVLLSAHRGDTQSAPENSLQAVRSSVDQGVDAVEIDVQLTRDGVVVLHHDYNLRRMAGVAKRVSELTYDEVARLNIGNRGGELDQIERIPMLAEVLAEVQGKAKLIIDLKSYGPGEELARQVVTLIEQFDMVQDCYIQSFDRQTLQQIRQLNPDIKIGQIIYFAIGDLSLLDVDFYTVEQVMLTEQLVESAHKKGREVWVWTVNSERNLKEVLKFEIDGIITDYPARAHNMVELNL